MVFTTSLINLISRCDDCLFLNCQSILVLYSIYFNFNFIHLPILIYNFNQRFLTGIKAFFLHLRDSVTHTMANVVAHSIPYLFYQRLKVLITIYDFIMCLNTQQYVGQIQQNTQLQIYQKVS